MKRVLFVDDDAALLSGIRRMFYAKRAEWTMHFAASGLDALALMAAEEPFNVVVSDMRMPGMDGATLLERVRDQQPEAARLILSGQSDIASIMRSVSVAHQFLSKPCDQHVLTTAIERSMQMHARVSDVGLRQSLGKIGSLPTPPSTITRINEALADPDVSVDRIGRLVEVDTALAAKLLQLVNSSFFGLNQRVGDVGHAITYLGLPTVRNLLSVVGLVRSLPVSSDVPASIIEQIHEEGSAVAARARDLLVKSPDLANEAFAAGVLHDAGLLVVAGNDPLHFMKLWDLRQSSSDPEEMEAAERVLLGASHADIGAYLLELWGLPYGIVEAVACHHEAPQADDPPVIGALKSAVRATADAPAGTGISTS